MLSKLITEPCHSILAQSYDCRLRLHSNRQVNADGFGIGWYTEAKLGSEPCIFTSTAPAWNCMNLQRIAAKTVSKLIFAHVRASTEGSLAETNNHPFSYGNLLFMHNGNIGAWKHVKRRLANSIADHWYENIKGTTDSELAFATFIDALERLSGDIFSQPTRTFDPKSLRNAMKMTIKTINQIVEEAVKDNQLDEAEGKSLLNFAVTDGQTIIATRYVSHKTEAAASLFLATGSAWTETSTKGRFIMERSDKTADVILLASEPVTFERHDWLSVPTNTVVTINSRNVSIRPLIDHYS